MNTNPSIDTIRSDKIVPVVVIDRASDALPLAKTLIDSGINNIEITLRTEAGLEAIRIIAEKTSLLVGAGTVLSREQADAAISAGSKFLVSPGTNPRVVERSLEKEIPILPGVCSPTDIELAASFGLTTLKFFPAEAAGGVPFLKAISAPYGHISFVPTGGITAKNYLDYVGLPSVIACGASWMVDKTLIAAHDWEEIGNRCRALKELITNNR